MKIKGLLVAGLLLMLCGCGNRDAKQCYQSGITALEGKDYDTAIQCFEQLIEEEKLLPEAYRGYGLTWMEMGSYPEAIAAFSRSLIHIEGNHPEFKEDVLFHLAEVRIANGNLEKAIEVYTQILNEDEKNVQAFYLRGQVYLDQKDYENAEKDFKRALKNCEDYNLYINIYRLYVARGEEKLGDAYLQMALAMPAKEGEDYYHRGRIYEYQQLYVDAKKELTQALELGYNDAMVLLGNVYLELEDVVSARNLYQDCLENPEQQAKAYNGLAVCDIYEGKYDDALKNVHKGLKICNAVEKQGLLYNEIVAYEFKKEFALAKQKMAAYMEKYPEDEDAFRENEFLSTR